LQKALDRTHDKIEHHSDLNLIVHTMVGEVTIIMFTTKISMEKWPDSIIAIMNILYELTLYYIILTYCKY